MSEWNTSQEPAAGETAVDLGLRSAQGIRWLLFAGALVVAVSVARLVAAEWGVLGAGARFLVLAAGALAIYAAGDFIRRRLRLPVAGSAFLGLFVAIVPLLGWGAARLRLLEAPGGWVCLALGLGGLLACARRVLWDVLGYRDPAYPLVVGGLLFAMPILPLVEGRWGGSELFFVGVAGAFGLLTWSASRRVNRMLFHRDRIRGVDRPVSTLPFVVLVLTYLAQTSLLVGFEDYLALPLLFAALALIDAGEEYYRAVHQVAGRRPESWPRRSVALLAIGFAVLAVSLMVALMDRADLSLALVSAVATLRLTRWGLRYRSAVFHGVGLGVGLIAYHAMPALLPDALVELFRTAVRALGLDPVGVAGVSLGDLGLVATLLATAGWLRSRMSPAMVSVHTAITGVAASLLLMVSLFDPPAARLVAPVCCGLLAVGVFGLRWKGLLPILYQALVASAFAWSWQGGVVFSYDPVRLALLLGVAQLAFLGGAAGLLRRRGGLPVSGSLSPLLLGLPLLTAMLLLLFAANLWTTNATACGLLLLVVGETFLLAAWLTGSELWLRAAAVQLFVWVPVQAASVNPVIALWLTALGWMVFGLAAWALAELAGRRGWTCGAASSLNAAAIGLVGAGVASTWDVLWRSSPLAGLDLWAASVPAFAASLAFTFLPAARGAGRKLTAGLATGLFAGISTALLTRLDGFARELYWLGPGLALIALSVMLRRELTEVWRLRLFTAGAACLYAMPVFGLLESLSWVWQIVLLLLAVGFGAASFRLRSRSLLTVSTVALVIDLTCFLIRLRQTEPWLLWVAGIAFGLGLMTLAGVLEHRREVVLQRLRIWGQELGSWA